MQAIEPVSIVDTAAPTTPPPGTHSVEHQAKIEQQADHPNDLPSPPTSVTKALSHRSIEDGEDKAILSTVSEGSPHIKDAHYEEMSTSATFHPAPPSPPPSTHSSEDSHTPIRPSYFYPQPGDVEATESTSTSTADDAPGIPVFEPTWEEFQDFYTFCQRIDEWGMKTGIVKVIPPKEWIDMLPRLDGRAGSSSTASQQASSGSRFTEANPLSQIRIKDSIEQIFTASGSGIWRQSNVVHPARVVNAKQWADMCAADVQKGPEMSRMKENAKRQAVEGLEEDGVRTRSGRGNRVASNQTSVLASRTAAKRKRSAEKEEAREKERGTEEVKGDTSGDTSINDMPELEENDAVTKSKLKMADRTTQQEWDAFDYVEGWCQEAGEDCKPTDWHPSVCKAIESEYWRGLNFGKAPMYGADLKGTLFTSTTRHWNVGCLDNILTRLRLRRKLPGVTTPYLYFGMWRATFAWHVEDMDLYSINYIHFGAPKQWYAIRQSDRQRFELAMAGAFPGDSARCKHFMRHKSYLASPVFLAANASIKPLRLVQKAQEFVITYPYGYHSGFNLGYNCAESVNFALESWLDIGRKAGYCDCAADSVKMDVDAMLEESKEMEELDRKKEEREKKREADEKLQQSEEQKLEHRRARERERRKARKEEYARLEALGLLPAGAKEGTYDDDSPAPPAKQAKTQGLPCIFCPSISEEDLVVVPYADDEAEQGKRPIRRAHRLCACFLPETWVGANPKWQEGSKEPSEIVMGFEGIEKARWSLKCQSCLDPSMVKKGAKVQCTFGKCSRTTHVSCALYTTSGWMLDMLGDDEADILEGKSKKPAKEAAVNSDSAMEEVEPVKQEEEVGEEDEPTRIVILCRNHNPREREREVKRRAEILRRCVETLVAEQMIKVRMGSGVWETVLKEVRWPDDSTGEGEVVVADEQAAKWSKILFDGEVVKKAEEQQTVKEEEEMLALQAEVAAAAEVAPTRPRTAEEEAKMKMKAEKEQAKEAEKERKTAIKQAKEEEKRIKEAVKAEKRAEKEAKAVEREAKQKIQAEKRAEREAKMAEKMARAAENVARMQGNGNKTAFADASAIARPAGNPEYDYIRQWKPVMPLNVNAAPRPVLPGNTCDMMERTLHPVRQNQQQPLQHQHRSQQATYSSAVPSSHGYPAHLATYQSRPSQHPLYYTMPHQQQQHSQLPQQHYQHPQAVNRSFAPLNNLQYPSQYLARPHPHHHSHANPYAYAYQQQQSYPGSQYPSPPIASLKQQPPAGQAVNGAPHPLYSTHKSSAVPMSRLHTEESAERAQQ